MMDECETCENRERYPECRLKPEKDKDVVCLNFRPDSGMINEGIPTLTMEFNTERMQYSEALKHVFRQCLYYKKTKEFKLNGIKYEMLDIIQDRLKVTLRFRPV
jgi:hypothetical protein